MTQLRLVTSENVDEFIRQHIRSKVKENRQDVRMWQSLYATIPGPEELELSL